MDVALGGAIPGLPSCVMCTASGVSQGSQQEVDAIVHARHAAQEWLSSVLMVPAVRESPIMRQFLCYGANVVPPQFEGLAWVEFTSAGEASVSNYQAAVESAPASYAAAADSDPSAPSSRPNQDEDMGGMFAFDDPNETPDDEDEDGNSLDSEDDAEYLQGRYVPTEEPLTQSEIMEIQEDYKEVEMVEDVGSLAQSLGASHLGRSLNLQSQMMSFKQQQHKMGEQVQQMQHQQNHMQGGIHPMTQDNIFSESDNLISGGIGGAVAKAEMTQAHVEGLGDSFHRVLPISAPRLDSFKMIKVVGKGSFGEFFSRTILYFSLGSCPCLLIIYAKCFLVWTFQNLYGDNRKGIPRARKTNQRNVCPKSS